jgi:hypothetical protein
MEESFAPWNQPMLTAGMTAENQDTNVFAMPLIVCNENDFGKTNGRWPE